MDNATFVKRLEAILEALEIAPEGLCLFLLTGDETGLPQPLARRLLGLPGGVVASVAGRS